MLKKIDKMIHDVPHPIFLIFGLSILFFFILFAIILAIIIIGGIITGADYLSIPDGRISFSIIGIWFGIPILTMFFFFIRHKTYTIESIWLFFGFILYTVYFGLSYCAIATANYKTIGVNFYQSVSSTDYQVLVGLLPASMLSGFLNFSVNFLLSILFISLTIIPFYNLCDLLSDKPKASTKIKQYGYSMAQVFRGFTVLISFPACYSFIYLIRQTIGLSLGGGINAAIETVLSVVLWYQIWQLSDKFTVVSQKFWGKLGFDDYYLTAVNILTKNEPS